MILNYRMFRYCVPLFLSTLLVVVPSAAVIHTYNMSDVQSVEEPHSEPGLIWERTYGGPYWDWCSDLIEVSDGGFAMTGSTDAPWIGQEGKMWLVRTDVQGNHLWNRTYENTGVVSTSGSSLVECSDGGFLLGGMIEITSQRKMWLVRTDSDGNHQWNRTYDRGNVRKIVECLDGGYALFGSDFHVVRLDADYNHLWNGTYRLQSNDLALGFAQCSDGGFVIVGNTKGSPSSYCVLLVRLDLDGNRLWNRTYEAPWSSIGTWDCGTDILIINSDFVIAAQSSHYGLWLIRTSANGDIIWTRSYAHALLWYHSNGIGSGESIVRCNTGGFAIVGFGWSRTAGLKAGGSGYLFRIDDFGNLLWDQAFSRSSRDEIYSIVECSDGGFAMAGQTEIDWEEGDFDFWLLRVTDATPMPVSRATYIGLGLGFAMVLTTIALRRREKWLGK
ncbi:MAG: hypothetical protein ACXABV_13050 [Candidatus Thorarchaeota archaeon]